MVIRALVRDLMDRSRITAALPGVEFGSVGTGADVVIVDLAAGADVAATRADAPGARIVCYGPHVDDRAAESARRAGADVVMARSRFFRDVAAAVAGPPGQIVGQGYE